MNKIEAKQIVSEKIQVWAKYYYYDPTKDSSASEIRRIENICRAAINRSSYELKCDNGRIYLAREDRERDIERSSRNAKQSRFIFGIVKKILQADLTALVSAKNRAEFTLAFNKVA